MQLLLDEHISPLIAQALRRVGHGVIAVAERDDLRGKGDLDLLVVAAVERCVMVTENIDDFAALGRRRLPSRRPHHGIVLIAHKAFPQSRHGIGRLVRALDALLSAHAGDDDLVGNVIWLVPAPDDPA